MHGHHLLPGLHRPGGRRRQLGGERPDLHRQDRRRRGGYRRSGGPLPGPAHPGGVLLLRRRKDGGRGGGVGQRGALPHQRGQPRGGRGAQLPLHRHSAPGRVQKQAAGPVPAGRSVRRAGGLVCQPCPQFRRRGGDGGHRRRHRGRWKPAYPVRPALHQLHGLRLGGWCHLLRHRLRPRRGHEPVRRQRPGQGGEELRRDFEVVLHRHRRGPLYAPEVTGGPGGTHAAGAA